MGLQIRELIQAKEIKLDDLSGRKLAVDSHNMLYQFLTTIRQRDGTPLMDSDGQVTSHLMGLLTRTANLLQHSIKPIFVFDGKPPELKKRENERRKLAKQEAQKEFEIAKEREDFQGMKKFASRTSKLDKQMIEEAKKLISAFGCPVVQAPSEGEAQAAHLVKQGQAYAVVSQDFDSLLYQTPLLVRNLSIAGRRKVPNKPIFQTVNPEIINLKENLAELDIDPEKLVALGMLVGTDYNIGGIKGLGPKKALALVKRHQSLDSIFAEVKWSEHFDHPWQDVYSLFANMPVTDADVEFKNPDKERIVRLLCDEHGFSRERVESTLAPLEKKQKGLGDFF